jgi:hypothetical protein
MASVPDTSATAAIVAMNMNLLAMSMLSAPCGARGGCRHGRNLEDGAGGPL